MLEVYNSLPRKMSWLSTFSLLILTLFLLKVHVQCKKNSPDDKKTGDAEKWKKKDVRDYSDADVERLFEQWEDADEDELEEDELPEWKREGPKIDMSQVNTNDPEGLLKMSKKGRTLMLFATVSGNPTQAETEEITQLWQGSLFNANYEMQRYVVSQNRVIFMLKDGALAWEIKDYLIQQERCEEVTLEGQSYKGKGASGNGKKENEQQGKSEDDKKKTKITKSEEKDNRSAKKKKTEL